MFCFRFLFAVFIYLVVYGWNCMLFIYLFIYLHSKAGIAHCFLFYLFIYLFIVRLELYAKYFLSIYVHMLYFAFFFYPFVRATI